jgi:hypothetical protein
MSINYEINVIINFILEICIVTRLWSVYKT